VPDHDLGKCFYWSFLCFRVGRNLTGLLLNRRSHKSIVAANVRSDPLCCIWTETPVCGCDEPWFASSAGSLPGLFSKSIVLTRHRGWGTTGNVSISPPADSLDRGGSIAPDQEFGPSRLDWRWAYWSNIPGKRLTRPIPSHR